MWRVDLICCGHEDGHVVRHSWEEANEFRFDYMHAKGHERVGIVVEDDMHLGPCNGYADNCPSPDGRGVFHGSFKTRMAALEGTKGNNNE